jgi:hypothetical protein
LAIQNGLRLRANGGDTLSELKTLPWAGKEATISFDGGVAYSEVPKIVEANE